MMNYFLNKCFYFFFFFFFYHENYNVSYMFLTVNKLRFYSIIPLIKKKQYLKSVKKLTTITKVVLEYQNHI